MNARMREIEAMKQKLAEDDRAYSQDRKEIAGALAAFVSIAEEKLNCVLQLNADF